MYFSHIVRMPVGVGHVWREGVEMFFIGKFVMTRRRTVPTSFRLTTCS